ncbi:hypothetical protein TRVA0_016S01376 [Trichomonascus vanleenenianus]|uniref:TFIIH complex subunit TFB6 n=1 Tax=Trichomonascus vanleenenianus TaxID=2268995 RepID=UPI003ECAC04B
MPEPMKQEVVIREEDEGDDLDYEPVMSPAPRVPSTPHPTLPLSERQQEKFRQYLDDKLLEVSRKYFRRLTQDAEPGSYYPHIGPLIADLDKLVDVVWYSITSLAANQELYGQTYYLLRIADEFATYLQGFLAEDDRESIPGREIIRFLQKLDGEFVNLLDDSSDLPKLTQTEAVRLVSIAERTRVTVMNAVSGYEFEVSQVYEGVLDKTS